ncbi:hypothetical protein IW245_006164 [Longispora fulva]|uniref:Uncharacterized protein n=1 Tax=Longispora fulva TaxID=619741 RepID=A0A8J7GUW0_9ACTN|nr:hypothetical protein [Longispora fulva]
MLRYPNEPLDMWAEDEELESADTAEDAGDG